MAENSQGRHDAAGLSGRAPAWFSSVNYTAGIYFQGSAPPFVVFNTETETVRVSRRSRATVRVRVSAPTRFASVRARANWLRAGRPRVLLPYGSEREGQVPHYSFLPKGAPLTFAEAQQLPSAPSVLKERLLRHLSADGSEPPATVLLKVYGFLLATAPLAPAARASVYTNLAFLPGVSLCGSGPDRLGRRGVELCASAAGTEMRLLLARSTGTVLALEQRIVMPSPRFPELRSGTPLEAFCFRGMSSRMG